MARRASFLRETVDALGWTDRVDVVEARAEEVAHDPRYRESSGVVTARGFAGPAATAEIGTAFVRLGGLLVVSEPPVPDPTRWPDDELGELGLAPAERLSDPEEPAHFAVLRKTTVVDQRIPRRRALPTRRPRW